MRKTTTKVLQSTLRNNLLVANQKIVSLATCKANVVLLGVL